MLCEARCRVRQEAAVFSASGAVIATNHSLSAAWMLRKVAPQAQR